MEHRILKGLDVLVIGGGIAGAMAAIKAREAGAQEVAILTKGHVGKGGNSAFAAGVMHVVHPKETDEDKNDRLLRLARAQGYLADQIMIQDHLEDTLAFIPDLESYGVEFERTESGDLERHAGRGAHPVIMFHGHQMMDAVMKAARKRGVRFIHHVMFTDLLAPSGRVVGAAGFDFRNGDFYEVRAKATVLATGSTWYKGLMVGHRDDTGDGYAAALRAGAALSGAESNDQISHAMPARFDIGPGLNMFQGLGGRLINARGERFMEKYIPGLMEKAGLRNLMYAFLLEIRRGNGPLFFDFTHFTKKEVDRMRRVIPIPVRMFERAGLLVNDRFVAPVEWMLCPPTGRPGLVVDREFETTLKGLFACGEAAAVWAVVTGLASAGNRGGVYPYKGRVGACEIMDGLGDQLLPCPALSRDEDVLAQHRSSLGQLDHVSHGLAVPDDMVEGVVGAVLHALGFPDRFDLRLEEVEFIVQPLDLFQGIEDEMPDGAYDFSVLYKGKRGCDTILPLQVSNVADDGTARFEHLRKDRIRDDVGDLHALGVSAGKSEELFGAPVHELHPALPVDDHEAFIGIMKEEG